MANQHGDLIASARMETGGTWYEITPDLYQSSVNGEVLQWFLDVSINNPWIVRFRLNHNSKIYEVERYNARFASHVVWLKG